MSSPNQMERRSERMEREKNRKVGSVTIEIIERVIKTLEKPGNSRIIMRVIEKIEENPKIKKIARIIEFNELAKCLYINLRIESKKTISSIAEYIGDGKNPKIKPIDPSLNGRCRGFCPELPFPILLVVMLITEKKKLQTITKKLSIIAEKMILPSFLKYVCQLIEEQIKQKRHNFISIKA